METGAIPETIGSFRIIAKIGQGGMGTVFRAMHGTLERPVALKILPLELANNAEYVSRFLREARTVAALRHDNIVQVYDAGEQNGQYYIAMELVDGCSLQKFIDEKGRVDEEEGMALLLQAAKGLAAAHAKGLVHRDIKPENMLLDKDNTLRLVDFGLVMESASTTQLTATGACLGTPMYMSPEQADGEHADARTDLYSLGVSFYRVFTGQPPFSSATVMNLLFKHKFEMPPDPQQIRPDLSQNVRNLLLHLMAKRREDRPQTAQALVDMIEGIAKGTPVPRPPVYIPPTISGTAVTLLSPGMTPRAPEGGSRKGVLVAAVILAAIVTAGMVFALTRRGHDTGNARAPIIDPDPPSSKTDFVAQGDDAFTAGQYAEALAKYSKAQAEKPEDADLKAKIVRTENARSFDETMRAAQALDEKGDLEGAAAKYAEAAAFDAGTKAQQRLDQIRAALAKDKGLNTKQRGAELDVVKKKALLAEKAEDYEVAAEQFSRAASLAEGADKTLFADRAMECRRRDYQAKGMAMEELKNYAEAEKWYKRALDIKPDALLQQKLEAVQQKTKPVAPATSPFGVAFGEGQKALEAGELAKARVQFTLALGAKPGDAEATVKLKEVEGREALAKGDAYRAAGVLDNALSAYTEALQKCPALVATATARIQALAPAAPPVSTVIAKIDDLVRAQKDTEALAEAVAAVRGNPSSKDLKDAKTSIESLTACADVYAELQKAVEAGLSRIRDVRDIDDEDKVRDWRDGLEKLRDRFTDRVRKPRPLFLAHNYQSVQAALVAARADAQELADQLAAAADGCDHRAEKAAEKGTGVKGPFGFSLGIGGDRKKAEKYRTQAEAFKRLAEQAKAQSK